MKRLHTLIIAIIVFVILQGCGGSGGEDSTASALQTATQQEPVVDATIVDTPNVPDPILVDVQKPLVEADPIDNRIIQPEPVALEAPVKVVSTSVATANPALSQSMWSDNVLINKTPNEYFVAVDGKSTNKGTLNSPWDLLSVANGDHVIPGNSIVWLKPGQYKHPDTVQLKWRYFNFKLSGEENAPIHIRPLPQEVGSNTRVTIDGGIRVNGSWLWIWELEQTALEDWRPWDYYFNSTGYEILVYETDRLFQEKLYDIAGNIAHGVGDKNGKLSNPRDAMQVLEGTNSKFVNMTLHGLYSGIGFWANPKNSEFYGNLVYDNGWVDLERAHGPGLYIQNGSGTERTASGNIVAANLSNPMQMRSTDVNRLSALTMKDNIFFAPRKIAKGRNYLHVGEIESKDVLFKDNITHAINVIFPYGGTPLGWVSPADQQCDNNFLYRTYILSGQTCVQSTTNEEVQSPLDQATTKVFIRPNKYDPRRANLAILNGERKDALSISLGDFAKEGDIIVIKNAVDPYGDPIAYGKYNGSYLNITWPNSPWPLESEKYGQDETTVNKEFWAFVIVKINQ